MKRSILARPLDTLLQCVICKTKEEKEVLWKDYDSITLTQVDVAQSDISIVQYKNTKHNISLVLVYMSVNDYNKNKIIYQYIQSNLADCASYIIMGDFNGHTGFLGPHTMTKMERQC